MLRNLALLVASALVAKLLADAPLEETLAAFARDGAVVSSCAKSRLHAKFGQVGWQGGASAAMVRLASSGNREKWLEPVALAAICHQQCRSVALLLCC